MPDKKPPAKKATAKTRTMSDAHKAALAEGRELGRAVRLYLEALETTRPKRGRKRTPESIQKRLAKIGDDLTTVDAAKRVSLIQERMDLEQELEGMSATVDITELETAFIAAATRYSESKGISYAAWREAGVPAAVLKAAGVKRSG